MVGMNILKLTWSHVLLSTWSNSSRMYNKAPEITPACKKYGQNSMFRSISFSLESILKPEAISLKLIMASSEKIEEGFYYLCHNQRGDLQCQQKEQGA